ncbi:MAG: GTP cyclohydrolase I, partial [Deltaproteobacteria bacterium]|nr:GTP cyclohydrolase I [Deltaproteobacteria bacterium]
MENIIKDLLSALGEDPEREGLQKTPHRVAKSLKFLTQGYEMDPKKVVGEAKFTEDYNEMILVKDIFIYSLCEHH